MRTKPSELADQVRGILAKATQERALASGAEDVQLSIRLHGQPIVRKGLLGMLRRTDDRRDQLLTSEQTQAVYEALHLVRGRHEAKAKQLEAQALALRECSCLDDHLHGEHTHRCPCCRTSKDDE